KATSVAYPLGDLLLGGMILRLAVGRGTRTPAFYLLVGSVVALLLTDSKYTYILVTSTYNGSGSGLDAGWGLFFLLWGAAALHPSMATLGQRVPEPERTTNQRRLLILASVVLMAPTVQAIQAIRGKDSDAVIVAAASAVLFILV